MKLRSFPYAVIQTPYTRDGLDRAQTFQQESAIDSINMQSAIGGGMRPHMHVRCSYLSYVHVKLHCLRIYILYSASAAVHNNVE